MDISENYFDKLINADEYYFQKGSDALQKWLEIHLSELGKNELHKLLNDYESFKSLNSDDHFFSIRELFFEIISYCDLHSRDKKVYNQYQDSRVLAKAGVRMKPWVINTFNYKYKPSEVNVTVKNALDMLKDPVNNINSIAISHRQLISIHYLKHNYDSETFVSELKEKFSDLETTKNVQNQTLLIAAHIYAEKKKWDKKQMNFKTFIHNLKEYIYENQLDYDFGKFNGSQKHIWIFDKEHYFNKYEAHYEVIIENDIISVDLHFEKGKKNSDLMGSLLGELPDFLEWKKWQKGNSVSHVKKFKITDENLIDDVIACLDELFDATSEKLIDTIKSLTLNLKSLETIENNKNDYPLNQILYGPPGTGKTYHTINKALAIIENKTIDELVKEKRKNLKERFNSYLNSGQIVFTTFHQSMCYEDFIEGIKPIKPEKNDSFVRYDIQNGVFKKLCLSSVDFKFKPGDKIGEYEITKIGSEILYLLKPQAKTVVPLPIYLINELYTLVKDNKLTLKEIKDKQAADKMSAVTEKYIINGYPNIFSLLIEKMINDNSQSNNHVFIIDEINRGNVSQIFGELITLIEEDKRLGNDESLEITLPYSKEKFGVPSNIYIIGTMNTADRSVEALDTALRRRFCFEEMPPRYEELKELDYDIHGFSAYQLLRTINQRIEKLIDKDHAIGHAYFIGKNNETIVESFYKNIIPLLQEYFFGDYGKIGLVIGKGFVKEKENISSIFANFDYSSENYDEREMYQIIDYRYNNIHHIKIKEKEVEMNFTKAIKLLMNESVE